MKTTLKEIADVIRSKNAGPYELTFDIIFKTQEDFEAACAKKIINEEVMAGLYRIPVSDVINIIEFKPAKAIKATIVRPMASGELGETDVYGAQQHAPLVDLEVTL
ncbi:DUF4387 domain-containing protein [Desulfoluna butyratoxydans]|uniref:DUF4387 domain-containing protein n=1 Tax=Desulfoluna butyratoxydans TaxID=231438 RepID=A0A4U8YS06_9BACT|nr:DUF4387 domain-containing protein [Desulfoluna butyratoxydans]VFQ44063.1 protein of unknown function duf4387 [Desulfoluna butyratoxydans]